MPPPVEVVLLEEGDNLLGVFTDMKHSCFNIGTAFRNYRSEWGPVAMMALTCEFLLFSPLTLAGGWPSMF